MTETREERAARLERAREVVAHEWEQFQLVRGDDGRAACQDNPAEFEVQRLGQFMTWPMPLLDSYKADLEAADAAGRNLLTEKYARMMEPTEPERYARELSPHLPPLTAERVAAQEEIVAVQVAWARDFHRQYPGLGAAMRVLTTAEDTLQSTSFETYLRGELGTYSDATLALYRRLIDDTVAAGQNLTWRTLAYTSIFAGYPDIDAAEAAQGP
ncbi:DUF4125 family protein [Demequina zhanjiangensis]|uniref:DUF4125 family protein n=1 Tax=Demequina zhanjiangensis TaxID=3051659 RepID=A0ABT8FX18_9MICO|nr:DUF4125 family protein [Demequina sp. SYSU T00b26]MDN4471433.1 DUF4125 family protein [Demequina sp. SYSU T00b26]